MPTLILDVSQELYDRLLERAAEHNQTVSEEVVDILIRAVAVTDIGGKPSPDTPLIKRVDADR